MSSNTALRQVITFVIDDEGEVSVTFDPPTARKDRQLRDLVGEFCEYLEEWYRKLTV